MNKRLAVALVCLGGFLGLLLFATSSPGQDPLKVAPKNIKLLLENDQVRVFQFHAKAGEKEPLHSHPAHVVYVVKGGKVKFIAPDGKPTDVDMKTGQAVWGDPTTHTVEIVGPGEVDVVVVELKGTAAKPAAKQPAKKQ